jgi:hypothetical protein
MKVRAKFQCDHVIDTINNYNGGCYEQRKVIFRAVWANGGENNSFSKATPSGNLDMVIDKETEAYDAFKAGKSYYLTFDEAPE